MNTSTSVLCPECQSYQNFVTDTRHGHLTTHSRQAHLLELGVDTYIRRRRRCSDCGHGWTTAEFESDQLRAVCEELSVLRAKVRRAREVLG